MGYWEDVQRDFAALRDEGLTRARRLGQAFLQGGITATGMVAEAGAGLAESAIETPAALVGRPVNLDWERRARVTRLAGELMTTPSTSETERMGMIQSGAEWLAKMGGGLGALIAMAPGEAPVAAGVGGRALVLALRETPMLLTAAGQIKNGDYTGAAENIALSVGSGPAGLAAARRFVGELEEGARRGLRPALDALVRRSTGAAVGVGATTAGTLAEEGRLPTAGEAVMPAAMGAFAAGRRIETGRRVPGEGRPLPAGRRPGEPVTPRPGEVVSTTRPAETTPAEPLVPPREAAPQGEVTPPVRPSTEPMFPLAASERRQLRSTAQLKADLDRITREGRPVGRRPDPTPEGLGVEVAAPPVVRVGGADGGTTRPPVREPIPAEPGAGGGAPPPPPPPPGGAGDDYNSVLNRMRGALEQLVTERTAQEPEKIRRIAAARAQALARANAVQKDMPFGLDAVRAWAGQFTGRHNPFNPPTLFSVDDMPFLERIARQAKDLGHFSYGQFGYRPAMNAAQKLAGLEDGPLYNSELNQLLEAFQSDRRMTLSWQIVNLARNITARGGATTPAEQAVVRAAGVVEQAAARGTDGVSRLKNATARGTLDSAARSSRVDKVARQAEREARSAARVAERADVATERGVTRDIFGERDATIRKAAADPDFERIIAAEDRRLAAVARGDARAAAREFAEVDRLNRELDRMGKADEARAFLEAKRAEAREFADVQRVVAEGERMGAQAEAAAGRAEASTLRQEMRAAEREADRRARDAAEEEVAGNFPLRVMGEEARIARQLEHRGRQPQEGDVPAHLLRLAAQANDALDEAIAAGEVPASALNAAAKRLARELADFHQGRDPALDIFKKLRQANQDDSLLSRTMRPVVNAAQFIRAIRASADLSGTLRQGAILAVNHPIHASKAFVAQVRAMFNRDFARSLDEGLRQRPLHSLGQQHGLFFSDVEEGVLDRAEEAFASHFIKNVPVASSIVAGSERAMATFLNKMRSDVWHDTVQRLEAGGTPLTEAELQGLAHFINVATGRGTFGVGPISQLAFFSPRFVSSRFESLLAPMDPRIPKRIRRAVAIPHMAGFVGALGTLVGLSNAAGEAGLWDGRVEFDPRSSDFMKIKRGDTRIDPWAGLQQPVVAAVRTALQEVKSLNGDTRRTFSWYEPASRFMVSKVSPGVGTGAAMLEGKFFGGQPATVPRLLSETFLPITATSIAEAMMSGDPYLLGTSTLLEPLGMGVQNISERTPQALVEQEEATRQTSNKPARRRKYR